MPYGRIMHMNEKKNHNFSRKHITILFMMFAMAYNKYINRMVYK